MDQSRAGYVYTIPTMNDENHEDPICDKQLRSRMKYGCMLGTWGALTLLIIYLAVHYEFLYQVTDKCKTELGDKSKNESFLMANIGELKQKNAELKQELKIVKKSLQHTEELYANAQDKIEIYLKTVKELKENINLKISTDFLTNDPSRGASILSSSFYYVVILVGAVYYIM